MSKNKPGTALALPPVQAVAAPALPQVPHTDSWVAIAAEVFTLAGHLAMTDFVPEAMRGKPEAVAAAILSGREVGVPPMTALANIHIVKGKPGQSAQLMRQLILSAGHDLRYVETNNTRCVVEGRRRGQTEWTRVTFTADQAKTARIDLGGYPEDKLVARATSRLARRVFADVLGGLPYLPEEAAEGAADMPATVEATQVPTPARRTAQRRPRPAPVAPEEPALDPPPPAPAQPAAEMATAKQMTAMATAMSGLGYRSRDEQHALAASLIGHPISSAKDITAQEAHRLLERFHDAEASGDAQAYLDELRGVAMPPDSDDVVDAEFVDFGEEA